MNGLKKRKWITITNNRQVSFIMYRLKKEFPNEKILKERIFISKQEASTFINDIIERLPLDDEKKTSLILNISRDFDYFIRPINLEFIEKNELYCFYIWLRLLSHPTIKAMIKGRYLAKGVNHFERLVTIYNYFDYFGENENSLAAETNQHIATYTTLDLVYDIRKECTLIFNENKFFKRIISDEELASQVWEKHFQNKPLYVVPLCEPNLTQNYPHERRCLFDPEKTSITPYLGIVDPKERNIAMQAIYYAWDKEDKNKFLKQVKKMLQTRRYRANRNKENKKLVQGCVHEDVLKNLKECAEWNNLTTSKMLETIIMTYGSYHQNEQSALDSISFQETFMDISTDTNEHAVNNKKLIQIYIHEKHQKKLKELAKKNKLTIPKMLTKIVIYAHVHDPLKKNIATKNEVVW